MIAEVLEVDAYKTPKSDSDWHAFRLLISGHAISNFGSQLALLALPTYAISLLGANASGVSLIYTLQWIPPLMFGFLAGFLADKLEQKRIIIAADILCGTLSLVVALFMLREGLVLLSIYAFVFLSATCGTFFSLASQSLTPSLLSRDDLARGNTYLSLLLALSTSAGQLAAARYVSLWFGGATLAVNGVSFFMRAICVGSMPSRQSRSVAFKDPPLSSGQRPSTSIISILIYKRALIRIVLTQGIFNLGGAYILGHYLVYAYNDLELSPGHIGLLLALGSGVAFATSSAFIFVVDKLAIQRLAFLSILVSLISVWLIGCAKWGEPFWILLIYQCIFSAASTTFTIAITTWRQKITPAPYQGRVASAVMVFSYLAMVIGASMAALSGYFVDAHTGVFIGAALSSLSILPLLDRREPNTPSTEHLQPANALEKKR